MYKLYGYKFFSSATDADIALTLARVVDPATGKITLVFLNFFFCNME
jgi:alkylation response protein AidB-like acyl-CoA dehydrogenase